MSDERHCCACLAAELEQNRRTALLQSAEVLVCAETVRDELRDAAESHLVRAFSVASLPSLK